MPIYEFYSPNNNKIYSFYSRSVKNSNISPVCPDSEKFEMRKMMSAFSLTGTGEGDDEADAGSISPPDNDPFSKLSDTQTSHVMKEMESAMQGMDEDNPDPRQMGSLMRRMCEMTGEKMDGVMEEVVRKLEEGSNPEELEERMGEVIDDSVETENTKESTSNGISKKRNSRLPLTRDPKLYEFEDFLP
jgi:hypothetical protein